MKIGVSSCLLGNYCRYDGDQNKDDFVVDELSKDYELIPYCPEEIIFGTPREPIRLVLENETIKVISNIHQADVTLKLEEISEKLALKTLQDDLSGFIFKSKSPSCGIKNVKLFHSFTEKYERKTIGLFAKNVKNLQPNLPIIDENGLKEPLKREKFLKQINFSRD